MHVVTVFDQARAARARALVRSVHTHHPEARISAVFVGPLPVAHVEGAAVRSLDEVWGARPWWPSAARSAPGHADLVLVAPALRDAVTAGDEPVVLLGCDLLLLAPLDPLLDALETAEIVLVPMAEGELPADGEQPDAGAVADAGVVNRRVLALRRGPATERLLAAWPDAAPGEDAGELPRELVADAVQRHLDRCASLEEAATVVSDPGLGLASWNLPLRRIADDGLTASGSPVRLLDLSGLDPRQPGLPWPAQSRFRASTAPALSRLLDEHARMLRDDGDPSAERSLPFTADDHGRPLDAFLRGLVAEAHADGALQAPPWTREGTRQLDAWLNQPGERGAGFGLTRYHNEIWNERIDLRAAYPFLDGPDGPGFAGWLVAYGPRDLNVPESCLPDLGPKEPDAPGDGPLPWGANVAGFFRSELGLGEAARLLIAGLDAATVPALPVQGALVPTCRQEAEFTFTTPAESPYPINVICMNGDSIPVFARELPESFFAGRHTIALWWWEIVGDFPDAWKEAFDYVDEVWVATDHIFQAVAPHSPKPVLKMPMPILTPRPRPLPRARLGFPEAGFVFFYMFDYHSTAARKNPVGHVEAFKRAFPPGSGAKLVLKCINPTTFPEQHERVLLAIDGHPDITLLDRYVSADEKNAMLASCDCYVSLHRSEGFGLTPAEAMALGKPVIATRYGGTMEFMDDTTAYLVDHTPVAVGPGAHPYPPEAMWVDPDLDHAASLMRRVFEERSEARAKGERAARAIAEHHSPATAGRVMRERLEHVYEGLSERHQPPVLQTEPRLANVLKRIDADPVAPNGPAKVVLRKASARVASPFVRRTQEDLYRAIDGLQRDVDRLVATLLAHSDRSLREERTQTLAALRRVRAELADQSGRLASVEAEHAHASAMPGERWNDSVAGEVLGFRDGAAFRAPVDGDLRELRRPYARLLTGLGAVLEVAPDGDVLQSLLAEHGVEARAVEVATGSAPFSRGDALRRADLAGALDERAGDGVGAIIALRVAEYLSPDRFSALLSAAHAALGPGGRLVIETVNPHQAAALRDFGRDPTRRQPWFPETTLELCREAGFTDAFVFHPGGHGLADADRTTAPVYAVVADRAAT